MTNGSPTHYLAQLIEGSAKIVTDTQVLHLNAGDVFYIPKNLSYRSFWYPENEKVNFYSFGFEFFPIRNSRFKLQKIKLTLNEQILLDELKQNYTRTPQTIGQLYYLLGEISPRLISEEQSTCKTINKALEFMRQRTNYTIKEVAEFCNVSEAGLYNKFKKYLNKTPVTIKQELLVGKAKELLLNTDLSIEEISNDLGFSSSSYFRKIFYSKAEQTPSSYRKENKHI